MNLNAYLNELALTHPDLSESELQEMANGWIGRQWLIDTKDGQEFNKLYAPVPGNVDKLARVWDTLDEAVSYETLSNAFRRLKQNRVLLTQAEIDQAAKETQEAEAESRRTKWATDCENWIANHSTTEVKARAESDKIFASYLRRVNAAIPVLTPEYSPEATAKLKKAQATDKRNEAKYRNVPPELGKRRAAESF